MESNSSQAALSSLSLRIIACERCPRLRQYCERIALVKKPEFADWTYWGKPLPGFGDPEAELLIVGLAPAAHGGNRTGRMFTGDGSGDWLIQALYETGFANQAVSKSRDDGLVLKSTYITAVLRCAPPANKPSPTELANCSEYLKEELRLLGRVKLVLTLGRIAFVNYLNAINNTVAPGKLEFRHGAFYELPDGTTLVASYHPSRQNTQTGRLTWRMWIRVFRKVQRSLGREPF